MGNTLHQDTAAMVFQLALYLRKKCKKQKKKMLENHKSNFKTPTHKEAITCPSRSLVIVIIIFFISFSRKLRLLAHSATFNCLMFTS